MYYTVCMRASLILWGVAFLSAAASGHPADIRVDTLEQGLDTHLIIGNGDVMAYIEVKDGALVLGASKNDVWDIRLDTSQDAPLLPAADIERIALEGAEGLPPAEALKAMKAKHAAQTDSYHRNSYPSPRMTARWRAQLPEGVRVAEGRVSIENGVALIRLDGGGEIRVYVHAERNAIVWEAPASFPAPRLEPILDPELIPAPESGARDGFDFILQELPDDLDMPGIDFAVAAGGGSGRYVVAHATSLETGTPLEAALRLCRQTLAEDPAALFEAHRAWWKAFWERSSISLEDADLEALWRRQLYFMGATIRADKYAPGLFAPMTTNAPAWHGDYHTNYNIQQTFWSVFVTNHCEMDAPYERLVLEYLPRARWLARTLYGVDGAFYPHVIMFNEPPPDVCQAVNKRQYIHVEWAYTFGVTAFTVQNLWWRYVYQPDRAYLESVAYPVISETARFYANVLEAHRGPDGKSRPITMSPEHWGWTPGLERNRNCAFDTALIAFNLKAAIEAARILGVDEGERARWEAALEWLPPYPTHGEGDKRIIVDVDGAEPIEYNIPIPSTVVFPGEQLTWLSEPAERELFARTIAGMRSNGNNDTVINAIARARLSMPDAYDHLRRESLARLRPNGTLTLNRRELQHRFNEFGHYTEMYGAAAAVSELLLQSVDGVIRVFPAWPQGKHASFRDLRAQGGFLVSAEYDGTRVTVLEMESTVGGRCRVLSPWARTSLDGKTIRQDERGIVAVDTRAKQRFTLREAAP